MPRLLAILAALLVLPLALESCGGPSGGDAYQKGLQAIQAGDWDAARKDFDAAGDYQDAKHPAAVAQQNAAAVTTAYDQGKKDVASETWDDALAKFNAVVQLSPSYKDAAKQRADVQQKLDGLIAKAKQEDASGDLAGAIKNYQAAGTYQQADQEVKQLSDTKSTVETAYN